MIDVTTGWSVGYVTAVFVEDGAKVVAGDQLLAVESMKTEHVVNAPVAGVVRLKVKLGEEVGEDEVVAHIEEG